jgi:general secretion pathway protein A
MYLDFYGFKAKPFELTPDPHFLYLGGKHKEALALLEYGVLERKGFILLTGEVGTGKTTMVHALLKHLDGATRTVHLSNSALRPEDFLYYVTSSLGIKTTIGRKGEFLVKFEKFLNECLAARTNIVLIVDEAQALSFELFEEIRLLSNMETGDEKLLNIILVGQPELNTLLSSPRCRPLLQRISIRYNLTPLNPAETRAYIQQRILASGGPSGLFHKSVAAAVHQYSNGYPRLINSICDNTLLLGYVQKKKKLTPEMVRKSHMDMKLPLPAHDAPTDESGKKSHKKKPSRKKLFLAGAFLALFLFALIPALLFPQKTSLCFKTALTYYQNLLNMPEDSHPNQSKITLPIEQSSLKNIYHPLSENKTTESPANFKETDEQRRLPQTIEQTIRATEQSSLKDIDHPLSENKTIESPANFKETDEQRRLPQTIEQTIRATEQSSLKDIDPLPLDNDTTNSPEDSPEDSIDRNDQPPVPQIILVKEGDTLMELALRVYGICNDEIIQFLKDNNPEIDDPNLIEIGQEIVFSELTHKEIPGRYSVHVASFNTVSSCGTARIHFKKKGEKVHILLSHRSENPTFRVALGTLTTVQEARKYANDLLYKGIVDYANPIPLPTIAHR